jgi:hypothetical protein
MSRSLIQENANNISDLLDSSPESLVGVLQGCIEVVSPGLVGVSTMSTL